MKGMTAIINTTGNVPMARSACGLPSLAKNSGISNVKNQTRKKTYIASFAELVGTDKKISSFINGRLFRHSSTSLDTYNAKSVYLMGADAHTELDTIASNNPITK